MCAQGVDIVSVTKGSCFVVCWSDALYANGTSLVCIWDPVTLGLLVLAAQSCVFSCVSFYCNCTVLRN